MLGAGWEGISAGAIDAGVSAKTLQRPALQLALGALKTGQAEALLVVKLDRLTRSVRDLGMLVETYFLAGKWSLMSVSEQINTRTAAGLSLRKIGARLAMHGLLPRLGTAWNPKTALRLAVLHGLEVLEQGAGEKAKPHAPRR